MQKKTVLPGESLSTTEEFTAGEGTYEENGLVVSANIGSLEVDDDERIVKVKAKNPPLVIKVGDVIIGAITDVKGSIANVDVAKVVGNNRSISSDNSASIHISKITNGYVEDMGRLLRIGDIIRAKVIQSKPSMQISTQGDDFGVIKALCMKCRLPLIKKEKELYCENCERVETRKIARDYGEGNL